MFYIFHIVPLVDDKTGLAQYMPLAVCSRQTAYDNKGFVRVKNPDLYTVKILNKMLYVQSNINKTLQHHFFLDKEYDVWELHDKPSIVVSIQPMSWYELQYIIKHNVTSPDVDLTLSKIQSSIIR